MTNHASAYRDFTLPGDLASLPASREQVMEVVREHGCDEAAEFDLRIALQEALANATLHGCGNDASKTIECSIEVAPSRVSIVVRDPGPGFDFETTVDPDRLSGTELTNGRGIALMRGLMDEVTFARGGSAVRLSKRITCSGA
jgi:serine/threonine-protein kinase RsbW